MPQYNTDAEGLGITGDVITNGKAMSKSFFLENAAYVPQEDRLWRALTGDESLFFLYLQASSLQGFPPASQQGYVATQFRFWAEYFGPAIRLGQGQLRRSARSRHLLPRRSWVASKLAGSFRLTPQDHGCALARTTETINIAASFSYRYKLSTAHTHVCRPAYVPCSLLLSCPLNERAQVRENLMFACKMYTPMMPQADCEQRVDEVVASLGLQSCQHTKARTFCREI